MSLQVIKTFRYKILKQIDPNYKQKYEKNYETLKKFIETIETNETFF